MSWGRGQREKEMQTPPPPEQGVLCGAPSQDPGIMT